MVDPEDHPVASVTEAPIATAAMATGREGLWRMLEREQLNRAKIFS